MQYVKFISKYYVEPAPRNLGPILNFDSNVELMLEYGYLPLIQATRPTDRLFTVTYIKNETSVEEELIVETDEQKAARERQEKDQLTLTPADVWRAIYKDKHLTKDDIIKMLEEQATGVDIEAIKIEMGASLYYRGAKFGNTKIFDTIGNLLGYTEEDLDYLFTHKVFPPSITEDDEEEE